MVFFFQVFHIGFVALTDGFQVLLLPGWKNHHILMIPILLGYIGFSWGIFNLSYDPLADWSHVKKSAYFIISGAVTFLVAILILIIAEVFKEHPTIVYILTLVGIVLLILVGPLFSFGFFLFRKDLKTYYFKKYIAKFPNTFIMISYLVQSFGYIFLLISSFFNNTLGVVFLIIGIVAFAASILGLGIGFYPLFISFRAYPKLLELVEEHLMNKELESSKGVKKAS
ncbi:MAG: hypothetical protein GOP50_10830 [Candidatus Heimdallarchaeota archaeon]|nr:hypothetical protein [Candidatus Heimdallarchaeota archaeon]